MSQQKIAAVNPFFISKGGKMSKIICSKCEREKSEKEFFMTKQHQRYPMCKSCLTMYIDNTDKNTFEWILKEFNVPYIEKVWKDEAQKAYDKNPMNFGSASVIGRYLRLMNMMQYRDYTYADTVRLAVEAEKKEQEVAARVALTSESDQEEFMNLQAKLDAGEISLEEFNTRNPLARGMEAPQKEKKYTYDQEPLVNEDEIMENLNDEERKMLMRKWGITYKPSQWLAMEEMYLEYENTFDLNVDSKAVVKQICQVYLKMNEALAVGDTNAYKSLSATYDSLRKSANLTKAQNKEDQHKELDSIGELVRLAERKKGIIEQIPWPDDYPQDKIDFCIKDMKQYMYNLVTKELGLGNLIESYIEKLEQQQKEQAEQVDVYDTDFILSAADEEANALTDQEAEEFAQYLENEIEEEAMRLAGEL